MKNVFRHIERGFEKLVSFSMALLGNSFIFILAVFLVFYWLGNKQFFQQDIRSSIGEIILSVTFLSMFIIQKSFNRFSASLHLKVNELVSSHEPARNEVIHTEEKTERELTALSKEYATLAVLAKEDEEKE